jgi:DNA-binding NarL/FixJ family response regulator
VAGGGRNVTGAIRLAVVDDHPVFREGTAALLARESDMMVVGIGSTLAEAVELLALDPPPDVLLLDVRLGAESGLDLLGEALDRTAVVVFTAYDYPQYLRAALRLGAAGFVTKDAPTDELLRAVRRAAGGGLAFDRRPTGSDPGLTGREVEVLRLLAEGQSNDEIGVALGITSKSVEAHLGRIFARTGTRSRTEVAVRAVREGWLEIPGLPSS